MKRAEARFHPTFLDNAMTKLQGKVKGIFQSSDLSSLEKKLAGLADTAESYKAQGVASGNARYTLLWDKATKAVDEFCAKYPHVDRDELVTGWPAMAELQSMTVPEDPRKQAKLVLGGLVGAVAVSILLAFLAAIYSNTYHFFTLPIR